MMISCDPQNAAYHLQPLRRAALTAILGLPSIYLYETLEARRAAATSMVTSTDDDRGHHDPFNDHRTDIRTRHSSDGNAVTSPHQIWHTGTSYSAPAPSLYTPPGVAVNLTFPLGRKI
jgi:hypothetical protein